MAECSLSLAALTAVASDVINCSAYESSNMIGSVDASPSSSRHSADRGGTDWKYSDERTALVILA